MEQIKKSKCCSFKSPGGHLSQWDLRQCQPTCAPKPEWSKAAVFKFGGQGAYCPSWLQQATLGTAWLPAMRLGVEGWVQLQPHKRLKLAIIN